MDSVNNTYRQFSHTVWRYYRQSGRHDLPWRAKSHLRPYTILVSEVMLQQTQVERVVPKYRLFLRRFPSAAALAEAPLGDVLRLWQGLGYNRRAKYLKDAASAVREAYSGRWPRSYESLVALPGVGPYTAGAVLNFAYNTPHPIIETNIRSVFLHHFFPSRTSVSDQELRPMIERSLDQQRPREWQWALMDYGAYLKRTYGNNIRSSQHYKKQSRFLGSDRQIRGAILRYVSGNPEPHSVSGICQALSKFTAKRVKAQLANLVNDGLLVQRGACVRLAT